MIVLCELISTYKVGVGAALSGSLVTWRFECGDVIEIQDGIISTRDCHI